MSAVESTERPTHLTPTTSPPLPSSPSDTDSPCYDGTGTEPGQGHSDGQEQGDEQSGNQEEQRLLRGLGVGLGTVIVGAIVLCVVVMVGIFYFSKRTRGNIDQVNRTTSEMPLRSLSTPTSPRSPSTSSPSLPAHTKESNALSPVATPKSLLPCNESDHKERGGEEMGNVSGEDGDSRQVLEQNAAKSGDHGNEEQVSPGVGEE